MEFEDINAKKQGAIGQPRFHHTAIAQPCFEAENFAPPELPNHLTMKAKL
jgi:hypothetical protein